MRTTTIYNLIKSYRDNLKAKEREFSDREKDIEDLKGSPRYEKAAAQISEERAAAYKLERQRIAGELDALINQMLETAKKSVPMDAPSEDALRTLQLMEMRYTQSLDAHGNILQNGNAKPLSREELQAAMPLMGGNPSAVQALRNIASKCGYVLQGGHTKGLSQEQIIEGVTSMARQINTLLSIPKINNRTEWANIVGHSIPDTTDGHAIQYFRLDIDYGNENEFLESMTFLPGESMDDFKNAVNEK